MPETPANPVYEQISQGNATERPIGSGKKNGRVRELIMPSWGSGNCYLKFVDERFGWYNLPLGKAATRKRDEAPTPEKNVLVPILPRVYTTPDLDPAQCAVPRAGGYLYVFRGKYLWRELEVLTHGYFRDVNLHKYAGRDHRPATVEQDNRLLLPWRLNGEDQELYMTYSEVQWSWARICQLGGMDPQDFRLHPDHLPPMPADLGYSEDDTARARAARLQQLDLSGVDTGFPVQLPEGRKARVENVTHGNRKLWHIRLHHKQDVPVVYLHDPLGVARCNTAIYADLSLQLAQLVEEAQSRPHFKSAVLALHTFFNRKLWKTHRRGRNLSVHDQNDPGSRVLREAARHLDRKQIEKNLNTEPRKQLRQHMRALKKIQAEWLEGKHDGTPVRETHPDFVDLKAALLDYATLPAPDYIRLWEVVPELTGMLVHDPASVDGALDLPEHREHVAEDQDAGKRYLASLLKPDHPLHEMLFPSEAQIDLKNPESGSGEGEPESPDPTGKFRPAAFAASLAPAVSGYGGLRIANDAIKFADRVVSDFLMHFSGQWKRAVSQGRTREVHALVRLVKAANDPALSGLRLVPRGGTVEEGEVVLNARNLVMEQVNRAELAQNLSQKPPAGGIELRDGEGVVRGYIDPERLHRFTGMRPALTAEEFDALFTAREGQVVRARAELLVGRVDSPVMRELYLDNPGDSASARLAARALRAGEKGLPALVFVVELFNLVSVSQKNKKDRSNKNIATLVLTAFAALHAGVQAEVKLRSPEVVGDAMERRFQRLGGLVDRLAKADYYKSRFGSAGKFLIEGNLKFGKFRIQFLGALGAGLTFATAAIAIWNLIEFADADDFDAAVFSGVEAFALVGLSGALLYEAGATFLGLGPVGWAFLALSILAAVIVYLVTDTPLEKWAKHGPYALEAEDRNTHAYADATPQETYMALLSLLMSPSLVIQRGQDGHGKLAVVDVHTPGFAPGKDMLHVHVTLEPLWANARGQSIRSLGPQQPATPLSIAELKDEKTGTLIGYRYTYRLLDAPRTRVRACVQRVVEGNISLPAPSPGQTSTELAGAIPQEVQGWACAEPVRIRP